MPSFQLAAIGAHCLMQQATSDTASKFILVPFASASYVTALSADIPNPAAVDTASIFAPKKRNSHPYVFYVNDSS